MKKGVGKWLKEVMPHRPVIPWPSVGLSEEAANGV